MCLTQIGVSSPPIATIFFQEVILLLFAVLEISLRFLPPFNALSGRENKPEQEALDWISGAHRSVSGTLVIPALWR